MMKKVLKKILLGILVLVLVVVAGVAVVVAINAPANVEAMNSAVNTTLEAIGNQYELKPVDIGDYRTMKVYGIMKFDVSRYEVQDTGSLSVMTMNMGVMQMATVVLTPTDKDIPLVSMDYMYMLGNRTCYLEFYDLVLDKEGSYADLLATLTAVKEKYSDLADVTPTAAWYDTLKTVGIYKSGTKADDEELNRILTDGVGAVMTYAGTLPALTDEERNEKIALQKTYSDGLIENGGVSTDAFVGSLGAEATKEFFDEVLFRAG